MIQQKIEKRTEWVEYTTLYVADTLVGLLFMCVTQLMSAVFK